MFVKCLGVAVLLTLAIGYSSAGYVNTHECPSTTVHSKDIRMQVSECKPSDDRCPLYQGKSHEVIFEFVTTKNYTGKIDFRVYGVFEKFSVPYRGKADAYENAIYTDNGESLKDIGMFMANRQIKHTSEFAVSSTYPKIELNVRFVVMERRTKETILCVQIPVGIKSLDENSS